MRCLRSTAAHSSKARPDHRLFTASPPWMPNLQSMNRNDLHFHVLPGVDDGPADLAAALALAADAVADGTSVVVATPHVRDGYVDNVFEIEDRVDEIQAALDS